MIDDLFAADTMAAARDRIANPLPPAPPPRKFSVWDTATAPVRGVIEAGAQVMGTAADIGNALRFMRDATPEQQKAMERGGVPIEQFSSDLGDSLRSRGAEFRPDPTTANTAEQLLYGFARGASKVVVGAVAAGPGGVLAAGTEEAFTQSDELRLKGVPLQARSEAGLVQGAGLALAALPIVGQTLPQTAALYLAGGPGGFMAQQALTREILRGAGQNEIAAQYDPFDPVGLAVSALLPAGFAAYGVRAQRLKRAADSMPAEMPREPGAAPAPESRPAGADVPPSARTAIADAVAHYPQEVVDAAMVFRLSEQARANEEAGALLSQPEAMQAAFARADELQSGIAALEAQRADLLPAAGDLAEPGAIRKARQELRLMEQTRVDASDAALRAAAKEIQAHEGVSYKAALADAKKQIGDAAADWQGRADRINAFIEGNARAQQATQAVQRLDVQLQALREEVAQTSPAVQWARDLAARLDEVRNSEQFKAFFEATKPVAEAPPAPKPAPATTAAGETINADGSIAKPDGTTWRDMTPAERADAQRTVIDLRKRAAILKNLIECIA